MKLYALIGEKLGHTMSPFIHEYILDKLDVEGNYATIEIKKENLSKSMDAFKTLGFSGINVTIPYKEKIIPYLDEISSEAKAIEAVNTIIFTGEKAIGYNTDYFGFGSMLERYNVSIQGKTILIFGSGGAAKALIAYFNDAGAKSILVTSKSDENMKKLQDTFPFIDIVNIAQFENEPYDIAVNATPIGMHPHTQNVIVSEAYFKNYETCIDIVYNPIKTKFLTYAEKNGAKTVDGLYMLIDQAIKAQEIFQNMPISKAIGTKLYDMILKKLQ